MDERRSSLGLSVAAACLVFAACLGLYVAGYFALGMRIEFDPRVGVADEPDPPWIPEPDFILVGRGFKQEWLVRLYRPMAAIETAVTGVEIELRMVGDDFEFAFDDSESGAHGEQ